LAIIAILAGQAGISGHLNIGNHVTVGPMTGVGKPISDGESGLIRISSHAPQNLAEGSTRHSILAGNEEKNR
jgi:UDP-3-O-[3-hydroxymyristoyl] glucosamine N-acyltransferase